MNQRAYKSNAHALCDVGTAFIVLGGVVRVAGYGWVQCQEIWGTRLVGCQRHSGHMAASMAARQQGDVMQCIVSGLIGNRDAK